MVTGGTWDGNARNEMSWDVRRWAASFASWPNQEPSLPRHIHSKYETRLLVDAPEKPKKPFKGSWGNKKHHLHVLTTRCWKSRAEDQPHSCAAPRQDDRERSSQSRWHVWHHITATGTADSIHHSQDDSVGSDQSSA